jgi:hypothetical protein
MTSGELASIRERVAEIGARIQPLLVPHPPLAQRNAFAHIWLGIRVTFGDDWRERADPASVHAFLEWIAGEPNADYGDYSGPVRERVDEPGLFDAS